MPLDLDYQRAAEAALAADKAAADAHAALFDFARQLGELSTQVQARSAPLPLHVRFVRRAPPNLAAPAGVRVDEAPKERPAGFASVVIETRDLFFAIESIPGVAVAAATNIPDLESYATSICGIRVANDNDPHLLVRTLDGTVAVPTVHSAGALLEAILAFAAAVFIARAAYNPLPSNAALT